MNSGWTQEQYLKMFGTKEQLDEYYAHIAKCEEILKEMCVPAKTFDELSKERFKIQ